MSSPQFGKRPCRPRDHVAAAAHHYPQAWRLADEFRADRGRGLPDWPAWCYLPLSASYAIVSANLGVDRLSVQHVGDVARLGALAAWRVTQGIYRFDPALYAAIVDTPVSGDVPHDVLYRLPEWCVYVETPGLAWNDGQLFGFFAHLEYDVNTGRPELRLLLDADTALVPVPLHLGPWSLAESISRAVDVARVQATVVGGMPAGVPQVLREWVEPLVSLLLYLCSQNAEIGDGRRQPANPEPKRTKSGWRLFPPDRPTTWDVGVRLGSALRTAYHAAETGQGGAHAAPRAHIRRAHWHGYWIGPREGERRFDLRWMPPIPVNVNDVADLPATVRPMK
ncbi:MAG: hypothetical protein GY848_05600 [Methyloversatilis sp.]|nr:hypothetical protein [Methyloversatilis sp.]